MSNRIAILVLILAVSLGATSINLGMGISEEFLVPVASYNFNDGGSTVTDRTGNGHTMTCTICPNHLPGGGPFADGAYQHTERGAGLEEILTIDGSTLDLHVNNSFSIAYDYKGSMTLIQVLLQRTIQFRIGGLIIGAGQVLQIKDPDFSGAASANTDASEAGGDWHHVAWVFNGAADTIDVYVDSVKVGGGGTSIIGTLAANSNDILLSNVFPNEFKGSTDNLRFYDDVLTLTQIQAIDGEPVAD